MICQLYGQTLKQQVCSHLPSLLLLFFHLSLSHRLHLPLSNISQGFQAGKQHPDDGLQYYALGQYTIIFLMLEVD
jgi:hypothetical protein